MKPSNKNKFFFLWLVEAQVRELDLTLLTSVREFCEKWDKNEPIHVLINNAGIFSMGGCTNIPIKFRRNPSRDLFFSFLYAGKHKLTCDSYEEHFMVNFLAPSLLTLLLLPYLAKAGDARVVNVNSQARTIHLLCHNSSECNVEILSFRCTNQANFNRTT